MVAMKVFSMAASKAETMVASMDAMMAVYSAALKDVRMVEQTAVGMADSKVQKKERSCSEHSMMAQSCSEHSMMAQSCSERSMMAKSCLAYLMAHSVNPSTLYLYCH